MREDYPQIIKDVGASLDAWLAGDREQSVELMEKDQGMKEWVTMCQKSLAKKRRFHVVEKPYTP